MPSANIGTECPECGSSGVTCDQHSRKCTCKACGKEYYASQCFSGGCYRAIMDSGTRFCPEHDTEAARGIDGFFAAAKKLGEDLKKDKSELDAAFRKRWGLK